MFPIIYFFLMEALWIRMCVRELIAEGISLSDTTTRFYTWYENRSRSRRTVTQAYTSQQTTTIDLCAVRPKIDKFEIS